MMHLLELTSWHWSPFLGVMGGLLLGLHLYATKFKITVKTFLFTAGLILAEIALALPMGPAPGQPLFSLHMVRHIILLMMAPPLLVAGLPKKPIQKIFSAPGMRKTASILLNPFVAWILGVGIMWFWHAPFIFNSMMAYTGPNWISAMMHTVEILSLLVIGILFCSPILFPLKEYRLPPLKGIIYLFTACSGCSILGILITFASPGLYHTVFSSGVSIIWGLNRQVDQQLGGLLMWVPGCFIYLSGVIFLLVRWFSFAEPTRKSTHKKTVTI